MIQIQIAIDFSEDDVGDVCWALLDTDPDLAPAGDGLPPSSVMPSLEPFAQPVDPSAAETEPIPLADWNEAVQSPTLAAIAAYGNPRTPMPVVGAAPGLESASASTFTSAPTAEPDEPLRGHVDWIYQAMRVVVVSVGLLAAWWVVNHLPAAPAAPNAPQDTRVPTTGHRP